LQATRRVPAAQDCWVTLFQITTRFLLVIKSVLPA